MDSSDGVIDGVIHIRTFCARHNQFTKLTVSQT